jgi:MoaA/NifB/PqqE/SkfB family radical SAM enzyme
MAETTMFERLEKFGLKQALAFLESDPDKNMPKLLTWFDRFDQDDIFLGQRTTFHQVMEQPDNNWYRLLKSIWTDIDDGVRKAVFGNFLVNATVIGGKRQGKYRVKNQSNIPWAILMDPTSACNLHCLGCWAADYGNMLNLDYATLDSIIHQGKESGTYMYIFSGGEPLIRKKDIIKLCDAHPECEFLAFTNGTLIDEDFADEMLRVKNFIPAISVEGYEEATDSRRGAGTYQAVCKAMELLKRKKLAFGISCCYTSKNTDEIGSEAYFDDMIEKGAKFAWFFTYMPVGKDAVPELMATAEQRAFMYRQIRKFRETKPIFTMDFWNDGEYVGGCIAGGRNYLHINANGDIEPCAFIHYSNCNIHNTTLLDAYRSPLFLAYKSGQPFHENLLRPCPLLDNPDMLQQMVTESGASSTDLIRPEEVGELTEKCRVTAEHWAVTSEELWQASHPCRECAGCSKT